MSNGNGSTFETRQKLNGQISEKDRELQDVREEIQKLQECEATIIAEREILLSQLSSLTTQRQPPPGSVSDGSKARPSGPSDAVDYMTESFEWDGQLIERMKTIFNIPGFRLCQRGWAASTTLNFCHLTISVEYAMQAWTAVT